MQAGLTPKRGGPNEEVEAKKPVEKNEMDKEVESELNELIIEAKQEDDIIEMNKKRKSIFYLKTF